MIMRMVRRVSSGMVLLKKVCIGSFRAGGSRMHFQRLRRCYSAFHFFYLP